MRWRHCANLEASVSVVIVLILVQVLGLSGSNPCLTMYRGVLQNKCTKPACKSCPEGQGVLKQCNGSVETVCEACVTGVNFSETDNPYEICLPVSRCTENRVVDIPATPKRDIKCKCKDGFYKNSQDFCVRPPFTIPSSTSPTDTSQSLVISTQHTLTARAYKSNITQPPHLRSRGRSSVSSVIKTPRESTAQPIYTKRPFHKASSDETRIIEDGLSSTVYIVIGVCVIVVVLITAGVVAVACCYYRYYTCCLKWTGRKCDDEELLVGQQSDRHGCVKVACVGVRYELTADVSCSWLPWRHYVWTKDGAILHSSSRNEIQNTTVVLNPVSPGDAGEYCCKNSNGNVKRGIKFLVKEDLLPSYQANEDTPIALKFCIYSTSITWMYKWYCNGQCLQPTNSNYVGESTPKLTIKRIRGCKQYWCVAKSEDKTLAVKSTVATVMTTDTHPESTNTDLNCEGLPSEIRCDMRDFGHSHLKDQEQDGQARVTARSQTSAGHHAEGPENSTSGPQGVVLEMRENFKEVLPQEATESHPKPFHRSAPDPLNLTNARGKTFSCVRDLTEAAVNHLATCLQARPDRYPQSLYAIAEDLGVNVDKVKSYVATRSDPASFILAELRAIHPDYPLSALCKIFVRNHRPECVRKLVEFLKSAGGTLHLPQSLHDTLYLQPVTDTETPNDHSLDQEILLLSVGSADNDETSPPCSMAVSLEDSNCKSLEEDVSPPSPPPLSQACPDRFFADLSKGQSDCSTATHV